MTDKLIMTTELAERLKTHLAGAIDEVDEADELYQMLQSLPMVDSEPVAWRRYEKEFNCHNITTNPKVSTDKSFEPLFTSPQALTTANNGSIAWEAPAGSGFIRYVTDEKYKKFAPAVQGHYRPFKCSKCSIQALTPITVDDVTEAIRQEFLSKDVLDEAIAAAYNAVIKNRSEA